MVDRIIIDISIPVETLRIRQVIAAMIGIRLLRVIVVARSLLPPRVKIVKQGKSRAVPFPCYRPRHCYDQRLAKSIELPFCVIHIDGGAAGRHTPDTFPIPIIAVARPATEWIPTVKVRLPRQRRHVSYSVQLRMRASGCGFHGRKTLPSLPHPRLFMHQCRNELLVAVVFTKDLVRRDSR